ncbi:restriction endonuclease subunit S [Maribacter aquivivus]|uniref:restriction endonuclease subunit S n=1 Tax=Maribacter aquivivus TaxID=228958 RepID=UPI0024926CBE|nr:restriction endonuclease subunit S [Maribacter aquivivus]
MQLLQHFKELTIRPKNAEELKGLILKLAIQGKLTANWRKVNPNVEPASELLKKIQKQKEQLVREKKIKKDKDLPKIHKDEILYELPEGWKWCRLDDVIVLVMGQSPPSSSYNDKGKGEILINGPVEFSKGNFGQTKTTKYTNKPTKMCNKGDLIVCIRASIGKTNIASNDACIGRGVAAIQPKIEFKYTHHFILANVSNIYDLGTGTTFRSVSKDVFRSMLFPLPPIEEQKEIVNVVETLFKEVEQLEQLTVKRISLKEDFVNSALNQLTTNNANQEWTFVQDHFKSFFNETTNIKKLRETVLQLAVQGKLTADWRANNPDTEDASILLKRIQEEKAQLIKDKIIKKEKALPELTEEEIPYELPVGWVWCRIKELGVSFQNGISKRGGEGDPTVVLRLADITNKAIDLSNTRLISMTQIEKERYNLLEGDILITRVNGSADIVGNFNPVPQVEDISYCDHFIRLRFHVDNVTSNDYISIIANSSLIRKRIKDMFVSTAGQKTVNQGHISSLLFSLPPLEEQKAIVEKVNALMGLCNRLEQNVEQNQEYSAQLMQSCLREVFEK